MVVNTVFPGNATVSPWRLLLILSLLQDATADLEKKVKRICDILKERQELAERERALTQRMCCIRYCSRSRKGGGVQDWKVVYYYCLSRA